MRSKMRTAWELIMADIALGRPEMEDSKGRTYFKKKWKKLKAFGKRRGWKF